MNQTFKIILTVITIILMTAGVGLLWFILQNIQPSPREGGMQTNEGEVEAFPTGEERRITTTGDVINQTISTSTPMNTQGVGSPQEASPHIYPRPITSYTTLRDTSSTLLILDKDTGNIYGSWLTEENRSVHRITNTTITGTQRAWWMEGVDAVYLLVEQTEGGGINNYLGSIKKRDIYSILSGSSSPTALVREKAPEGRILAGAVSFDGRQIILATQNTGGSQLSRFNPTTGTQTIITNIPLTEIQLQWTRGGVFLSTNTGTNSPGALYRMADNGDLLPIISGVSNFSALVDVSGNFVLNTEGSSAKVLYRASSSVERISQVALPEKCVWDSEREGILYCALHESNIAPFINRDAWYRGEYQLLGKWWWIDTLFGKETDILFSEDFGSQLFDVLNPTLDHSNKHLLFKDRRDSTLWALTLPKESSD